GNAWDITHFEIAPYYSPNHSDAPSANRSVRSAKPFVLLVRLEAVCRVRTNPGSAKTLVGGWCRLQTAMESQRLRRFAGPYGDASQSRRSIACYAGASMRRSRSRQLDANATHNKMLPHKRSADSPSSRRIQDTGRRIAGRTAIANTIRANYPNPPANRSL